MQRRTVAKVESMLVGKWKVDGSGVGVDVASCTNQSNFENEKSDQELLLLSHNFCLQGHNSSIMANMRISRVKGFRETMQLGKYLGVPVTGAKNTSEESSISDTYKYQSYKATILHNYADDWLKRKSTITRYKLT
ncbi:hypothetical protein P8452_37707 [Trifolium repens]|nr:hypothetical protein P8452_37707 [Trifolium repens]